MIQNNHVIRGILYILMVAVNIAAIFMAALDPGSAWATALDSTGEYLAAVGGMTALANLSSNQQSAPTPGK